MKVHLPTPLHSYTGGKSTVDVDGKHLGAVMANLDERFPGLRFRIVDEQDRIRRHIKVFVNETEARNLARKLSEQDVVHVIAALSGG